MTLQSPAASEQAGPISSDDRRYRLIDALHELKNSIASVEQQHSFLGNDLSSTCDRAILSLRAGSGPTGISTRAESSGVPQPPDTNPLSLAVDRTGAHIIKGLDKMGDGIIFLFLKIRKTFD